MGKYKAYWIDGDFSDKEDLEEEKVEFTQEGLTDTQVHDQYFKWLCTPLLEKNKNDYWNLLRAMQNTVFKWSVPNDDNRGSDGINIREDFIETRNLGIYEWSILMQKPCSVLEMVIGVAIRIEDIMDTGDFTKWFWELIANLDLISYTDEAYYRLGGPEYVKQILQNFLNRDYQRNGNGGLFPLRSDKVDQRKVEVWYQMNAYLQDRYGSEL